MASIIKLKTLEVLAASDSMNAVIVSQAGNGDLFVSTLARVNEREVRYVGIAVDGDRLDLIKNGHLTLLDAFVGREGVWVDCMAKSTRANVMEAIYRDDEMPSVYLPPAARLYPGTDAHDQLVH